MNLLMIPRLALKALRQNILRTALTMLGIIIGVGAVIAWLRLAKAHRRASSARSRTSAPTSSLKALRARDFTVTSIRKHTVGEHPESLFIRVWKQAAALELARGLRFALDVEVGAAKVASNSGRR